MFSTQFPAHSTRVLLVIFAIILVVLTYHAGDYVVTSQMLEKAGFSSGRNNVVAEPQTSPQDEWKREMEAKYESLAQESANTRSELQTYKKLSWIYDIGIYDYYHEFSQTNADSILQFMFQNLGTTDKYYVEFGTENGDQTNTRFLREMQGWTGLLLDGSHDRPEINLHKEMILKSNIMELFQKYNVPTTFDLLSVDIDYNTFWVWKAIDHKVYSPRVLVVEYTADWSPSFDSPMLSTNDCETCMWDGSEYQGANAQAIAKLGRDKGYTMVYMEVHRVNMYFVRTDLIGGQEIADDLFPFKRIFRWGRLNQHRKTDKKPVTVNGLEG